MGVRLNIVDNVIPPLRGARQELGLNAMTSPMSRASPRTLDQQVPGSQSPATNALARTGIPAPAIPNSVDDPGGPLLPTRAGEGPTASARPTSIIAEANAGAGRAPEPESMPAPRIRNFRFLQAAQSMRERKLEAQFAQLERRLENANNRMQFSESAMVQVDARLERARLEQDLEMIATEINRLRLIRAFARPAAAPGQVDRTQVMQQVAQTAGETSSRLEPATSDQTQILNLLA